MLVESNPQSNRPFVFPTVPTVTRVARRDVPSIHSADVDGKTHQLGVLKDFSWHPMLSSSFLSQLSMSWVRLEKGQTLSPHCHPTPSIIVVCKGNVRSLGDYSGELEEGDILIIPAGHTHGFIGSGADGFWGLSLQPAENGLYSNPDQAKVAFTKPQHPAWLAALLQENHRHLATFESNRLFELFASPEINEPAKLSTFLSLFQAWSDCFQQLLVARTHRNPGSALHAVALAHLEQERGHNTQLRSAREESPNDQWDQEIAEIVAWFLSRMRESTDVEQTVLMHIVIEASADIFYRHFGRVPANDRLKSHIEHHIHHDTEHAEMGIRALSQIEGIDPLPLLQLQEEGWRMLGKMFDRMATLTREPHE